MNLLDKWKKYLAPTLTILTITALFGVVFLEIGLAQRSTRFYTELVLISVLAIQTRIYWFETTEDNVLNSPEINESKKSYYALVDSLKVNIDELDECLTEMDEENYKNSIKETIGHYTEVNLGKKKYAKLVKKAHRKAYRIKKLKSSDIMTRGESLVLYDTKNYQKSDKTTYQFFSNITSIFITLIISAIAFEEIRLNWENVFRYIIYVWSIFAAIVTTILYASKKTRKNTLDHLARLQFILDKFAIWREKRRFEEKCLSEEQAITRNTSESEIKT